jgi:hypothetical protein
MTFLAAPIWNQIAKTQELQSPAAKLSFLFNSEQLAKQDDLWMRFETAAKTPTRVARCLPVCLPLLVEKEAINQHVNQNPELRNALPEILDEEEAATLMEQEYRLTKEEKATLTQLLSSPQSRERWLRAAQSVQK